MMPCFAAFIFYISLHLLTIPYYILQYRYRCWNDKEEENIDGQSSKLLRTLYVSSRILVAHDSLAAAAADIALSSSSKLFVSSFPSRFRRIAPICQKQLLISDVALPYVRARMYIVCSTNIPKSVRLQKEEKLARTFFYSSYYYTMANRFFAAYYPLGYSLQVMQLRTVCVDALRPCLSQTRLDICCYIHMYTTRSLTFQTTTVLVNSKSLVIGKNQQAFKLKLLFAL